MADLIEDAVRVRGERGRGTGHIHPLLPSLPLTEGLIDKKSVVVSSSTRGRDVRRLLSIYRRWPYNLSVYDLRTMEHCLGYIILTTGVVSFALFLLQPVVYKGTVFLIFEVILRREETGRGRGGGLQHMTYRAMAKEPDQFVVSPGGAMLIRP